MDSESVISSAGQRSGRAGLNKQRVIDAALAIVDREGLDALNMRRLGAELGVDPMAIYRHVDGRDGVLDGLAERMWEEVNVTAGGAWREQLREFARALRRVFHAHPNAAPLMLQRFVIPAPLLESVHLQLKALHEAGFSQGRASTIIRTLQSFGIGYGLAELACFGVPVVGAGELPQAEMLVLLGQALPPGTPPHLVDAAIALYAETNPDAAFEAGLELLLTGLAPDRAG